VTLEITVNSKGEVVKVKIVKSSGYTELDESAARAAKKAKFTPASSDGKSVESVAQLTLEFKLKG
jgi:protein TonB